jgi:3-mercaptopyruvate sulfurtransferase SseA
MGGVTASILFLALVHAGFVRSQLSLYDGSWTQWASKYADRPEMRPKRTELA